MTGWGCPNDPRCGHYWHDVYDADDEVPTCCTEGCDCGRRMVRPHRSMTREEYADWRRFRERVLAENRDAPGSVTP